MSEITFSFMPLSIRLETLGGVATPLVLRGTPLPAKRSEVFSTAADNQSSVEIRILFGESPLVQKNLEIGKFLFSQIPPARQGQPKIMIEFSVDASCSMTVRAQLEGSKLVATQTFGPPEKLSDDFIRRKLAEAESSQLEDNMELRQIEVRNEAKAHLREAEQRLQQSPNPKLSKAVAALGLALESGDSAKIQQKSDALASSLSSPSFFGGFDFSSYFQTQSPAPKPPQRKAAPGKPVSRMGELKAPPAKHVLGKIFGGGDFVLDPQLCFVLMPFAFRFQEVYEDGIQRAIKASGLRCERADEIRGTTLITWDVWERINRARFLIADLTGQNPNVFYELGLAHALGKDVILITQSMDFVPFDLKAIRCIVYDFTPRGMQKLQTELVATVDVLIKSS